MKKTLSVIFIFVFSFFCFAEYKNLNDNNFYQTTKDKIFVVDFYADWCGPCRAFAPTFDKVSDRLPNYNFGKVNTDNSPKLSGDFNIEYIPFIAAVKNGKFLEQYKGSRTESDFYDWCLKIFGDNDSNTNKEDNGNENKNFSGNIRIDEEEGVNLEEISNFIKNNEIDKFQSLFISKKLSINSRDSYGLKQNHYAAAYDKSNNTSFF